MKIKDIIIPLALVGLGFYVFKTMQQTTPTPKGNGEQGYTDIPTGFKLIPDNLDPDLKRRCDESYAKVGANRYLCYRGLKQPKVSGIFL